MRLPALASVLGALLCGCGSSDEGEHGSGRAEARPEAGRQVAQASEGGGPPFRFLLYLPKRYGERTEGRWPLLLFLHGANITGSTRGDLELLRARGVPAIVERRDLPFIVVSPQTPSDWPLEPLAELLHAVERRYRVDRRRVYVTGFSIGGYATFDLASAYPRRFAAIAPVAAGRWTMERRGPPADLQAARRRRLGLPRQPRRRDSSERVAFDGRRRQQLRRKRPPDHLSGGRPLHRQERLCRAAALSLAACSAALVQL